MEYLALKCGSAYISDIRKEVNRPCRMSLRRCVERIAPEKCSLKEWEEAAGYITGEKRKIGGEREARDQLIQWLGENA